MELELPEAVPKRGCFGCLLLVAGLAGIWIAVISSVRTDKDRLAFLTGVQVACFAIYALGIHRLIWWHPRWRTTLPRILRAIISAVVAGLGLWGSVHVFMLLLVSLLT